MLPHVCFIIHCPKLSPERKEFLLEYLDETRMPIRDIRWFEDYNYDHPFVEWVNFTLKLPYGPKLTSINVKYLKIFEIIINENIENAIIIVDDILFHKDWVKIFNSFSFNIDKLLCINIGNFEELNLTPGNIYKINNNGSCEGVYITKQFCKLFLEKINLNHGIDLMIHGFLNSIHHELVCIPICYQTSEIEKNSILDHNTKSPLLLDWVSFVKNYDKITVNYYDLKTEYEKFLQIKKQKEDKLFEIYGKRINLKNIEYIMKNT
jgi:GR25 family glycosyltransferase involved in LPS biosynthesis